MNAINFSEQLLEFADLETLYDAAGASSLLHELECYHGIVALAAQVLTYGERWRLVFQQMRSGVPCP